MSNINEFNRPGEYFDMCHVVGDKTSELQLCEMEIGVVFRNTANAAVRNMMTLPTTPHTYFSRNACVSCM